MEYKKCFEESVGVESGTYVSPSGSVYSLSLYHKITSVLPSLHFVVATSHSSASPLQLKSSFWLLLCWPLMNILVSASRKHKSKCYKYTNKRYSSQGWKARKLICSKTTIFFFFLCKPVVVPPASHPPDCCFCLKLCKDHLLEVLINWHDIRTLFFAKNFCGGFPFIYIYFL